MRCYQLVLDDAGYFISASSIALAGFSGALGFLIGGPVMAGVSAAAFSSIPAVFAPDVMDFTTLRDKVKWMGYDLKFVVSEGSETPIVGLILFLPESENVVQFYAVSDVTRSTVHLKRAHVPPGLLNGSSQGYALRDLDMKIGLNLATFKEELQHSFFLGQVLNSTLDRYEMILGGTLVSKLLWSPIRFRTVFDWLINIACFGYLLFAVVRVAICAYAFWKFKHTDKYVYLEPLYRIRRDRMFSNFFNNHFFNVRTWTLIPGEVSIQELRNFYELFGVTIIFYENHPTGGALSPAVAPVVPTSSAPTIAITTTCVSTANTPNASTSPVPPSISPVSTSTTPLSSSTSPVPPSISPISTFTTPLSSSTSPVPTPTTPAPPTVGQIGPSNRSILVKFRYNEDQTVFRWQFMRGDIITLVPSTLDGNVTEITDTGSLNTTFQCFKFN